MFVCVQTSKYILTLFLNRTMISNQNLLSQDLTNIINIIYYYFTKYIAIVFKFDVPTVLSVWFLARLNINELTFFLSIILKL